MSDSDSIAAEGASDGSDTVGVTGGGDAVSGSVNSDSSNGGLSDSAKQAFYTGAVVIAGIAGVLIVGACLFAWCKRAATAYIEDDDEASGGAMFSKKRWRGGMGRPNPLVRDRPGALCRKKEEPRRNSS